MMAKTRPWLQLWLAIKPNLRCSQFGKSKKKYEDKIAGAEANIDGTVQDMIDKAVRIENQVADVQKDLDQINDRIKNEKAQTVALEGTMAKNNATVAQLESEVAVQEGHLSKAEQDRTDKDDQIRTLRDEIAHQGDTITKLGKEKRNCTGVEDKCNHLSRVKGKLEQALDEAEDALEREKKAKGDIEKSKQKMEGELGRLKRELEKLNIAHEGTLGALRMKHNNTMADLGKQIDSLSANKVRSEKDKSNLELDLRDARCDLEDAVKGKAELDKTGKLLQGNIVDANTRLDEMALNEAESSKKRLQVEDQDLSRQIDELEAAIANMNKSKISVATQLENTKALADAENKDLADEIKDLLDQLGEGGRSIHDLDKQRRRLEQEKEDHQEEPRSCHGVHVCLTRD